MSKNNFPEIQLPSGYRLMWLFVFFDLPTQTKKHRKAYQQFRDVLLKDGFTMYQFSVYTRHCISYQSAEAHINKVEKQMPAEGKISILNVTDKQFEKIVNYFGSERIPPPDTPQQLEMF
jgi:CRISPR-associated protein Cas2